MIIRAVTSFEVAENFALVSRLKHYYDTIDSSFKPFWTTLPRMPGPSTFLRIWASFNIYRTFQNAIYHRKTSGEYREDALQQLLDAGESEKCVVGVCDSSSHRILCLCTTDIQLEVHDWTAHCRRSLYWNDWSVNGRPSDKNIS